MPGDGAVGGLGGAVADHQHRIREPAASLLRIPVRDTPGAAGAQRPGQLAPQLAASLQVEGLIDRLGRHLHLRPLRELEPQPVRDLPRTPVLVQPILDRGMQFGSRLKLAWFGAGASTRRHPLRGPRMVAAALWSVPAQLPGDRRRRPPQPSRDPPHRQVLGQQIRDRQPLLLRQESGRDRSGRRDPRTRRRPRRPPPLRGAFPRRIPASPNPSCSRTDTNDPGRLSKRNTLFHEPKIRCPLSHQPHPTLRPTIRPNPETHHNSSRCCNDP